jgi:uncharacterized membrane protein
MGADIMSKTVSLTRASRGLRGAIAAITVVVILGVGAFAVAMNYVSSERNLLQVTADAAALAAAPELPNPNKAWAKALVETNMPSATHGKVLDRTDVFLGNWNPVTETWLPGVGPLNAIKVTIRPSSANFFARILSLLGMEVSAFTYIEAPTGRMFVIAGTKRWQVQQ